MDRFHALQLFVRIVETGSFSLVAKEFSLGQASVSKKLMAFERELQTKLLARTTRRLTTTEAGLQFYHRAKAILADYDLALSEMQHLELAPKGVLRLSSPVYFGRKYITPVLSEFCKLYPDVVIDHQLSDSMTDLVHEGIDVAVRMGEMPDTTHRAKKIASFQHVTVATKSFIKAYGCPKHPSDLARLPCVVYTVMKNADLWVYRDKQGASVEVQVKGPYRANAIEALREAALAGMGVARGSTAAFAEELRSGHLQRLLPGYDARRFPVHAVMPATVHVPTKSRLIVDFLEQEFKKNPLLRE